MFRSVLSSAFVFKHFEPGIVYNLRCNYLICETDCVMYSMIVNMPARDYTFSIGPT